MFYDFAITVPANTPKGSPVTEELDLTRGVVHRVEVQFPIGCRGLVHVVIMHGGHQFLPTNPDGNFASDGYIVPIDEYYELDSAPFKLKVICWNDDDTYQHIITVRVGIQHKEVLAPLAGIGGALRKFLKYLGMGG